MEIRTRSEHVPTTLRGKSRFLFQRSGQIPNARELGPVINLPRYDRLVRRVLAAGTRERTLIADGYVDSVGEDDPVSRGHHNLRLFTIISNGPRGCVHTSQTQDSQAGFLMPYEQPKKYGIWILDKSGEYGLQTGVDIDWKHPKAEKHQAAAIFLHRKILRMLQRGTMTPNSQRGNVERNIRNVILTFGLPFKMHP